MAKPDWYTKAKEIHEEYLKRAREKGKLTSFEEVSAFFALAIAGEAGELANLLKKEWRGNPQSILDIAQEMADIRIYLEHMAVHLKINLDLECEDKLVIVQSRLDKVK